MHVRIPSVKHVEVSWASLRTHSSSISEEDADTHDACDVLDTDHAQDDRGTCEGGSGDGDGCANAVGDEAGGQTADE